MKKLNIAKLLTIIASCAGITLFLSADEFGLKLGIVLIFAPAILLLYSIGFNSNELSKEEIQNLSLEEVEKEIYILEMRHYDEFSREKLKRDPLYQNLEEHRKMLLTIDSLAKEKRHFEILCSAKELMNTHDPFLSAYQVSPDSSIGNLPPAKEQELGELAQKIASKIIEQNHYDINK